MSLNDLPTREEIDDLVRQKTERRSELDQDRRDGKTPLSIDVVGDLKMLWTATGIIADGESKTIFLTWNLEAGGNNLFDRLPDVLVMEDSDGTGGGMARTAGPTGPSASFSLRDNNDFKTEIIWDATNEVFTVKVTNNTGASCDFAVRASGI